MLRIRVVNRNDPLNTNGVQYLTDGFGCRDSVTGNTPDKSISNLYRRSQALRSGVSAIWQDSASSNCCTMYSPSPRPFPFPFALTKGSNTLASMMGSTPRPLSLTTTDGLLSSMEICPRGMRCARKSSLSQYSSSAEDYQRPGSTSSSIDRDVNGLRLVSRGRMAIAESVEALCVVLMDILCGIARC